MIRYKKKTALIKFNFLLHENFKLLIFVLDEALLAILQFSPISNCYNLKITFINFLCCKTHSVLSCVMSNFTIKKKNNNNNIILQLKCT